ncbi:hypothetical protein [Phyllobacterium zundukense]|uniref:Uncharacterized protein n=1 Tax=Phyllobacterium zundukense TaxID=1867719 RepID=A0A2N9W2Z0_9HYPH|nr:hypothetical protein [Phyllobacterium zundukense]ATU94096.1 hypothetical protein BLM14_20145 [Phyllobacterium zundukense]PIO46108.1 hypothetical protein B5P45_04065 [Phyllobacterium zundukense]
MLHLLSQYSYSPEDWGLMQRAHAKASLTLDCCPHSHEHANRLARTVMKLFDQGLRDELLIAKAVEKELTVTSIASEREHSIAS